MIDVSTFVAHLESIADRCDIVTDPSELEYYSADISGPGGTRMALVLRPHTMDALRKVVRIASREGMPLFPRGSGLSYTNGYISNGIIGSSLDLSCLDEITAIDTINRFITVQAGCTWESVHQQLDGSGFRTQFAGPLSGYESTVGGALSHDAAFFGSALYGSSREGVLGVKVLLGDGSILQTGIHQGAPHPHPVGPDLTSLFLGDGGAFGVKAEATLRLVPKGAETRFASFGYPNIEAMLAHQQELIDQPSLLECFGFDRNAHRNLARGGLRISEGAEMLSKIAWSEGSLPTRMARMLGTAARGQRFVADVDCSLHLVFQGPDEITVQTALNRVTTGATKYEAFSLPDTIPRVTHTRPFRPVKALLGPMGERWLPVHGIFRPGDVQAGWRVIENFRQQNHDKMVGADIDTTALTVTCGHGILLELHFFWPDALEIFQRRRVTSEQIRKYGGAQAAPESRALVHQLRRTLADKFTKAGATHFQVGRYYNAEQHPAREKLLSAIKSTLDPNRILNPGVGRHSNATTI